ncbi:MAG: tetratricopeptide repeat protein, partial [Myxococcota bacterium]
MSSPDDTLSVDGLDSARRVPRLEAGAHIGRYVILELLGEGGMGAVYSAFDPSLNRRVALKLLGIVAQDSNAKEQAHARLQREAQALAQVRHPSVATVHDVGATPDGEFYIAMQFVEGEDLRHYCKDRPWREIVEVYTRAASGLAACHREGLVHRDFKPSNVMVEENGRPVILDFGLARAIEESSGESDPGPLPEEMAERVRQAHKTLGLSTSSNTLLSSHLTVNGALMGTPAYMSPEQLHAAPLGAQTDQYSFCAAMYEALYGVRPVPGDFQSAPGRDNQRHDEPPKESTVPRWYHRVLARGLDRDPEHRWDSMDELATQLRRDPSRAVRTRAMGVAALLAVVLIVLGVVNYRRSLANECREKGGRISEIWNGKRAIELGERFLAIPLPYAAGTWDRTKTLLNEYAAEWRSRRTEMCLARTLEGSLSTETAMRANACFDESATALRSLADQWSQPDEKHVQTALSAVFSLPPLDNCQDEVELSRRLERAKENTASTQLRIRLAESNALRHTGRYDESVKVAEHVLEQANTHPSLSVAAKLAIGRAKDRLWDNEGARSALKEAYLGADSEGLDTLALDAAIALIRVVGSKLSDARESAVWEGIAKARIHRMKLGPEHVYRATLLDAIGRLREHQGLYEESQRILAQAIEIRSASLGESTPENVRTMNNLGIAYYRNGRYEDAAKWIDRARRIARDAFGPGHPSYANSLSALSVALNRLGRTDEALKLARRALT